MHLVLRLRGGMMHVSSGRVAYVSTTIKPPQDVHDETAVDAKVFEVDTGTAQVLTLYAHPRVTAAAIAQRVAMELDPSAWTRTNCARSARTR